MANPRKDQDEKELENLAKTLLSMPHKPREESKVGHRPKDKTQGAEKKKPRLKSRGKDV